MNTQGNKGDYLMPEPKPVTIDFGIDACTFDTNDFVEWEVVPDDMPIGEVIFWGSPFTDDGYTELGRVKFDYCDHGLSLFTDLISMIYEAQNPKL